MRLPTIEPYIEAFFWLTSSWKKDIPTGFVRKNDIVTWLTEQMMGCTERFGLVVSRPYPHLAKDIFERMLVSGFVAVQTHEVAGDYFCIDVQSLAGFRNTYVLENQLVKQYEIVGAKLFDDIFDVYANEDEFEKAELTDDGWAAPAADRIVRFDDNEPAAEEISRGLNELKEDVRGANDPSIEDGARKRVLAGLDSAIVLWTAGELRLVQLKIGVLMAVNDASEILAKTSKAVSVALLIDAIKAFIKNHFKVDLDLI